MFGWSEVITRLTGTYPLARSQRGPRDGVIIQAGETVNILDASLSGGQNQLLMEQMGRLKISACYCSLYEECWTVEEFGQPQPIDACIIDKNRQWRNQ